MQIHISGISDYQPVEAHQYSLRSAGFKTVVKNC